MSLRLAAAAVSVVVSAAVALPASAAKPQFRHIAFDTPLDAAPRPGETLTEAVRHFHATGENRYVGDPQAAATGRVLYETWCQSCHMPDGSGRIGASLIGKEYTYPRTATDIGLFEAIYGGALGAMQPFRDRMTQDQILKLIAYIHTLRKK